MIVNTLWGEEETESKECIYCKEHKRLEEFQTHLGYKDKLDIRCRSCIREQSKLRQKLKKLAPPKPNSCECCGIPTKSFTLDHCHVTLQFRGWLCINCNMGIGKLGDTIDGVDNARRYLTRGNKSKSDDNIMG